MSIYISIVSAAPAVSHIISDNIVYVCGKDRDELIGLALALKTDRYLRGKDYPYISYNDKHLAEFDYYGSSSMENEKFAAVLPELV